MVQTQKIETVRQVTERFERAQAVVLIGYQGMSVAQLTALRNELRKQGGELKVVKNRLVRRALEESGCDALDDMLVQPTALAFGYGDATVPAKVCAKYAKDHPILVIKGGLLEKRRLPLDRIQALAKLPNRTELLTQMAGTMKAPIRQMATAMKQAISKIVYAMKDRAEQLEAKDVPAQPEPETA